MQSYITRQDDQLSRSQKQIRKLERKIENQESEIESLKDSVIGLKNVVHELIRGLYTGHKRKEFIEMYLNYIGSEFCEKKDEEEDDDDDDDDEEITQCESTCDSIGWGNWPTTRQGNKLEIEMEILKKKMNEMSALLEKKQVEEINKEVYDDSSLSSGSSKSEKRLRSNFLCGNE